MFAVNAREYAANPYLPWKLGLILLAGINITLLHGPRGVRIDSRANEFPPWLGSGRAFNHRNKGKPAPTYQMTPPLS
jgi:hypothetical protein